MPPARSFPVVAAPQTKCPGHWDVAGASACHASFSAHRLGAVERKPMKRDREFQTSFMARHTAVCEAFPEAVEWIIRTSFNAMEFAA